MLVKTNEFGYLRDTESGAIINDNNEEYKKYLAARKKIKSENNLCQRIDDVEKDLKEIKNLLLSMVHRNN